MYDPLPVALPLPTAWLGHPLVFLRSVDSTNRLLAKWGDDGAAEGFVLVADFQQAGRGRRGRDWVADPGSSLLFSLLLRPTMQPDRLGLLPLVVGVAVARALEKHLGLRPALKWPNDLLLDGQKCAGSLIEMAPSEGGHRVVVGTGLNVNQEPATLASLPEATSLRLALGHEVPRGPLLAALLGELERAYDDFRAGWQPHESWHRRATLLGQPITVHPAQGTPWPATAVALAEDGSLLVQDEQGERHALRAADVSVRATRSDPTVAP